MPASVVKTPEDERHWTEAKKQAAKQGRVGDYEYIMGIFKRMSKGCRKSLRDHLMNLVKARKPISGQMSMFGVTPTRKLKVSRVGPFIGPRGGKWADAKHTIPWKEEAPKPPPKIEPKPIKPKPKPKQSTMQQAMDLARELDIPAEQAGPRSIALGGAAAFDRTLGKWNRQKGSAGRRIASTAKALAWLKENGAVENRREKNKGSFKSDMDRRRMEGLVLRGNTYAHKEAIKAAGGVWDRNEKCWLMPDLASMTEIKQRIGRPKPTTTPTPPAKPVRRRPSEKQLRYARSLLNRTSEHDWFDSDWGDGVSEMPSIQEIESWSASEVSDLIDNLRGIWS